MRKENLVTIANKDISISAIRLVAMCCIVLCHMMQYVGMELAYWFNVGVQVFLCISGYLYGKRVFEENVIRFYKKQFGKILLEYYVVVIVMLVVYFLFARSYITVSKVIGVLTISETISGMGHLWYIAPLLLCYILIPVYAKYFDYMQQRIKSDLLALVILLFVNLVAFTKIFTFYNSAIINCFVIGFFIGRMMRDNRCKRYIYILTYALALGMNGVQIYRDYICWFELPGVMESYYGLFCNYAHTMLGVALFLLLRSFFGRLKGTGLIARLCGVSDKYSYEVYLVHHVFVLSPFSLMGLTPFIGINIILILLCIGFSAFMLNACCKWLRSFVKARCIC